MGEKQPKRPRCRTCGHRVQIKKTTVEYRYFNIFQNPMSDKFERQDTLAKKAGVGLQQYNEYHVVCSNVEEHHTGWNINWQNYENDDGKYFTTRNCLTSEDIVDVINGVLKE